MRASEIPAPNADAADAAFERRVAAVTQAVDDYQRYLLDYLYRLTRQWQDAENLLQDLWRHVLLNFDEDKIRALPLLRRKAYQLFIDHYRRQVRRGEILSDELPEIPSDGAKLAAFTDEGEAAMR
jgi:DNA-directed RNA polymerase specialized sigma24 family protein